jgi:hypothetical protein
MSSEGQLAVSHARCIGSTICLPLSWQSLAFILIDSFGAKKPHGPRIYQDNHRTGGSGSCPFRWHQPVWLVIAALQGVCSSSAGSAAIRGAGRLALPHTFRSPPPVRPGRKHWFSALYVCGGPSTLHKSLRARKKLCSWGACGKEHASCPWGNCSGEPPRLRDVLSHQWRFQDFPESVT